MEPERHEVYERIPWESLEKSGVDRQWLYVGLAGIVAVGALAYSFVRSQPVAPLPVQQPVPTTVQANPSASQSTPATVASPMVMAEADLYAVDPERLIEAAAAHAEWFAVEYFSVDGSEQSAGVLGALLPAGIPLPEAPPGTKVFVDWVGTQRITETGHLVFEVDVLVRSLVATPESGFVRQPSRMVRVEVSMGDDGEPRVRSAPSLLELPLPIQSEPRLLEVPADVAARVSDSGRVVGGIPGPDGVWRVVVMVVGSDGVARPVTLEVPAA